MEFVLVDSRLLFRHAPTISFALLTLTRIATGVPINMLAVTEVCDGNHRQAERWLSLTQLCIRHKHSFPPCASFFVNVNKALG